VTDAPGLRAAGLVRLFGEREALAGVSVSVPAGSTLGVFGPNGAGKTTLLRVLATLLRPHAGEVSVAGCELPREEHLARAAVGYLGHEPLLYRDLTPRENLSFHARLRGLPDSRVEEMLDAVGMTRRARDPVRELSRGMVQRVAAARALLHEPQVLLLDEPYTGLDPAARELLEPLIGRTSGRTRVLVTHDIEGGLAECDIALGLRAGRPAFAGSATAEQVREHYR
jgi:heme exporter protein A